jgi:hypothetical protein
MKQAAKEMWAGNNWQLQRIYRHRSNEKGTIRLPIVKAKNTLLIVAYAHFRFKITKKAVNTTVIYEYKMEVLT